MNYPPTGFRSASTLSLVTIIGLALMCVCEALTGTLGIAEIIDSTRIVNFGGETNSPWFLGQGVIALFQVPLYIATFVIFLIWLFRIYKNLDSLNSGYREFTPGWAVGWWFIPFANLVKPFQVIREAWCESDPNAEGGPSFLSSSSHSAPTYIGLWWGLWIASNIFSNIAGRFADPASLPDVAAIGVLFALAGWLSVAAGVLCIKLVRDITTRQERRSTNLVNMHQYEPPPPPSFGSEME